MLKKGTFCRFKDVFGVRASNAPRFLRLCSFFFPQDR